MTNLERLRLSTALAHVVPGATLHVACHSGQQVHVGAHPGADLDACAMRKVVIARACREVPRLLRTRRGHHGVRARCSTSAAASTVGSSTTSSNAGSPRCCRPRPSPNCSTLADRTARPTMRCTPA